MAALDPEIIALRIAQGAVLGFVDVAEIALKAAQGAVAAVLSFVEVALKALLSIFRINYASVSASLRGMTQGDLANIHLNFEFFGRTVDLNLNLDFAHIGSMIKSLVFALFKLVA